MRNKKKKYKYENQFVKVPRRGLGAGKGIFMNITLTELLFPRRCPVCGGIPEERGRLFCASCMRELPYIRGRRCAKCGKALSGEGALCRNCSGHGRSFRFCLCLFRYDGVAAEIMAGLKYRHKREYAEALAYLLFRQFGTALRVLSPDALIPVPVHKKRRKQRGYNQAEEICKALCIFLTADMRAMRNMGLSAALQHEVRALCLRQEQEAAQVRRVRAERNGPLPAASGICEARPPAGRAVSGRRAGNFRTVSDLLIRSKNTEAQKDLNAAERLLNLQQAFSAGKRYTDIKTVVLLDDIYTTGATMEACTRVLLSAGVEKVYGLCVCAGADV